MSIDGPKNACSAKWCNTCKEAEKLKEKRRMCDHELWDVFVDTQSEPIATEITLDGTDFELPADSYKACSSCGAPYIE